MIIDFRIQRRRGPNWRSGKETKGEYTSFYSLIYLYIHLASLGQI